MKSFLNKLTTFGGLLISLFLYTKDDLYQSYKKHLTSYDLENLQERIKYSIDKEGFFGLDLIGLNKKKYFFSIFNHLFSLKGNQIKVFDKYTKNKRENSDVVKFEKSEKNSIFFSSQNTVKIAYRKLSDQISLYEKFHKINKGLKITSRDISFHPKDLINIQFIFLFEQTMENREKKFSSEKLIKTLESKKDELKKILKLLDPEAKISFNYFVRDNLFKNRNYFDKETMIFYDTRLDSWRLKNENLINLNLMIPIINTSQKLENIVGNYRNNFVFELKTGSKFEIISNRIKRAVFEVSGMKILKDRLDSYGEVGSVSVGFLKRYLEQARKHHCLKEIDYYLQSIVYVEKTLNIKFYDEILTEIKENLDFLKDTETGEFCENWDVVRRIYNANRQKLFEMKFVYLRYRFAYFMCLLVPLMAPVLKAIRDSLGNFVKKNFFKKKVEIENTPKPSGFLPIIDQVIGEPLFPNIIEPKSK